MHLPAPPRTPDRPAAGVELVDVPQGSRYGWPGRSRVPPSVDCRQRRSRWAGRRAGRSGGESWGRRRSRGGSSCPGCARRATGARCWSASRDTARGEAFAAREGVEGVSGGYQAAARVRRGRRGVHRAAELAITPSGRSRRSRQGKAVLCEKPLTARVPDTDRVLARRGARQAAVGGVRLPVPGAAPTDRRADRRGGDRRARGRSTAPSTSRLGRDRGHPALGRARRRRAGRRRVLPDPSGARAARAGRRAGRRRRRVGAPRWRSTRPGSSRHGDRRLTLTCGLQRAYDTFTRVLGDGGPPAPDQPVPSRARGHAGDPPAGRGAGGGAPDQRPRSFTAALRHIHAVVRGEEAPRHLAVDSALSHRRDARRAAGGGRMTGRHRARWSSPPTSSPSWSSGSPAPSRARTSSTSRRCCRCPATRATTTGEPPRPERRRAHALARSPPAPR